MHDGRMTQRQVPDVRLLYFDACPNWRVAEGRLKEVLVGLGADPDRLAHEQVTTAEQAEALHFRGSPTILVDGHDPFAHPGDPGGLACRLYRTDAGTEPVPTVDQLRAVITP